MWVQEIETDAGIVQLPMLKIDVPALKRTGGRTKDTIVSLIIEKLTQPLSNGVPEDIFTFYQLVAMLGLSDDLTIRTRSALIDSFEKRGDIGILPLLRLGNHLPCAKSIRQWKEKSKHKAGVHQLVWVG